MPLGTEMPLGPGDAVLDGGRSFSPLLKGHSPQFSVHVYCGQTAGWVKTPLGTEVDLGPGAMGNLRNAKVRKVICEITCEKCVRKMGKTRKIRLCEIGV